jgi:hypothetical protein
MSPLVVVYRSVIAVVESAGTPAGASVFVSSVPSLGCMPRSVHPRLAVGHDPIGPCRMKAARLRQDDDFDIADQSYFTHAATTQGAPTMDQKNLDMYGYPPLPWSRATEQLANAGEKTTYFLATIHPDGRPNVAGVGALWVDDRFYFTSGDSTRKSRNLAENNAAVLSVALPNLDLVVEGTTRKVTDDETLKRLAERYAAQGWPATVESDALTAPYSAPSAGPAPWYLYEFTPKTAFGVATAEPYGATRWRFDA